MINYRLIGSRIRAARKKSNMTQEGLAELLNITPEHMSRLETGATKIGLEIVDGVAEALSIEVESLLFGITTTSPYYLTEELSGFLKACSPKKIEAIVEIAKTISEL